MSTAAATDATRSGRLTAIITWALVAVGALAVLLAVRSMFIAGIGYDALFEAQASIVNRGIDSDLTLQQAYDAAPITSEFYGMLLYQLAEIAHQVFTRSSEWMSPDDPATYVWQNSVNLTYGVVASAAIALAVGRALNSRLAGAFVWAALLTTPLWLGMSVIDYKDMPVAAGLTLISAALMWGWTASRGRQAVGAVVIACLGATIALGGRAGSLPLIVAIPAGTVIVFTLAQIRTRQPRRLIPIVSIAVLAPLVALVVTWLTNPIARIDLPTWLTDSISISKQYVWVGVIRTAGQDLASDHLPWWYAPAWLLAQLPLLTTIAAVAGIVVCVGSVFRARFAVPRAQLLAFTPLFIQGFLLPIAITATGAVLYDGIRHLLFIFPAIIALAALTIPAVQRLTSGRSRSRVSWLPAVVAAVIVLAGFSAVIRWYPYHYAFINPIAGMNKTDRQWELDYWGVSAREGVARLKLLDLDPIAVIPASEPSRPFGGLTGDEVNAIAPPPQRSGIYAFLRWDSRILTQWCGVSFQIMRDGQLLGEGGYCPK